MVRDRCLDNHTPYRNWTGQFHEHSQPMNFFQLLEGALEDPRARIGRIISYPPSEEIFHISEMIRNPLAHGSLTAAILEDYKGLFFTLILLYHDIVNPHNYLLNDKYRRWIYLTKRNMRLDAREPTLESVLEAGTALNLDSETIRINYPSVSDF